MFIGSRGLIDQGGAIGWIDQEIDEHAFTDMRLVRRLRMLLGQLSNGPSFRLPMVCQDWANAKAACRTHRVEAHYKFACHVACPGYREAAVVCDEMEN